MSPDFYPLEERFWEGKSAEWLLLCLRGCVDFGSEGERDELSDGFASDFEVRSSATGQESGREDADRSRAQPRIENQHSLLGFAGVDDLWSTKQSHGNVKKYGETLCAKRGTQVVGYLVAGISP